MDRDSVDDRASQNSGGNNQPHLPDDIYNPPMQFSHLSDTDKQILLNEAGYLYGFFLDGHSGPRRSSRPVVRQKDNAPHAYDSIQERNDMVTEVIESKSERDANFAHQGWSLSAISKTKPWIASRIAKRNRAPGEDLWITKRVVVQRLAFTLALQDLEAAPEFEGDVRAALDKKTRIEKFQALDEVFRLWGDVIPLVFDIGIALSISDLKADFNQSLRSTTPIKLDHLTMFKTARINTQGGEANLLPVGDAKVWLSRTVPPQQWSQVRVLQTAPVTDLLNTELQKEITGLFSTLLSYCPPNLKNPIGDGQHFGGGAHGLKTISSLDIRSGGHINDLCAIYLDGTRSDEWSDNGGKKCTFELNNGEHITEVMAWSDSNWLYALQFITSDGRISPHYGGEGGTPTIMNSIDGVLVAFSGSRKSKVSEVQTVWRHDIFKTRPSQNKKFFRYFGGIGGVPFNDQGFLNASETAYITSINVRSGTYIDAIQFTYHDDDAGGAVSEPTPWHGGPGGKEEEFRLRPGEYVIQVQGKHNEYIVQLCFRTNMGRISKIYGGGVGTTFSCEPPHKRLSYVAGKSGKWVNGLLFVWTPLTRRL